MDNNFSLGRKEINNTYVDLYISFIYVSLLSFWNKGESKIITVHLLHVSIVEYIHNFCLYILSCHPLLLRL